MKIGALCILCHDADEALIFYRDVLGYGPTRAEESFYSLSSSPDTATLCLWEIGHIARHSVFSAHPADAIPSKYMISAVVADEKALSALKEKVTASGSRLLNAGNGEPGLRFVDPYAVIWDIRIDRNAASADGTLLIDRITLLCRHLAETRNYYENQLDFSGEKAGQDNPVYCFDGKTTLALWDVSAAADELGMVELANQRDNWKAHTGMLAIPHDTADAMNATFRQFGSRGVFFDEPPAFFAWEFDASYFRDPENNIWELFAVPENIDARMLPQSNEVNQ